MQSSSLLRLAQSPPLSPVQCSMRPDQADVLLFIVLTSRYPLLLRPHASPPPPPASLRKSSRAFAALRNRLNCVMHRVFCFRDGVVFLIYLYQRRIYSVDMSRGVAGEDAAQ